MDKSLKSTITIDIRATAGEVWSALTNREMIKEYLWGTEADSDWETGSAISFTGTWEGTTYEDRGYILKAEKDKILSYSYWSSFWGTPFDPDNLSVITFELEKSGDKIRLKLTQEGFENVESLQKSVSNWKSVIANIKELVERNSSGRDAA